MSQQVTDPLAAPRQAVDRHAWKEAYDLLTELDSEGRLEGEGLELLGSAAWWAGHPDVSIEARERAFSAFQREGDRSRAAMMALLVARDYRSRLSPSVAQGWQARARRILEDEPEGIAHGYLALTEAMAATDRGDLQAAADRARDAVDIGTRFEDRELLAYGLVVRGMALAKQGDLQEGLALVDEAAAAAVSGDLSPFATGLIYCLTISTCRDLADYRRAGEWTELAHRWCERQSISGFPGVCRVHRAEILSLRGAWTRAEEEALLASRELLDFKVLPVAGEAFYAVGEIRLRMGDLAGAEEAFRRAHDLGVDPQPGLALLHLAQGRRDAALASIRVALAEAGAERTRQARLLPAQVDIALEARDVEAAAGGAEELSAIASEFGTPALHAAAHLARGAVLVATGRPADAVPELVRARGHWQEVEAPYEVAHARVWLGRAHREAGALEEAALELEAARSTFERLGAGPDAERSRRLLAELHEGDRGRRVRRTFLFTDIVDSTRLIGVIGDEAWGDVRRWHDQAIRSLVARYGGEEVKATGDGFFLAFPDPRSAVDCAVAIQRALADHRRSAGFAPRVRIGAHSAEATRAGDDYLGQGVHLAARVAAVAGGGEILVTPETLAQGIDHPVGEPRPVELKGIPGTVEVRAVEWPPPA